MTGTARQPARSTAPTPTRAAAGDARPTPSATPPAPGHGMPAPAPLDPTAQARITVKLAEYGVLTTEEHNRADYQFRIVQMHMTALSLLLLAVVTKTAGQVDQSHWLLLLVPFEASLFGMWWMDQAIYRRRVSRAIRREHEAEVNALVGAGALGWESGARGKRYVEPHGTRSERFHKAVHDWTFRWPALTILVVASVFTLINVPPLRRVPGVVALERGTADLFPVSPRMYEDLWVMVGLICLVGWRLFAAYAGMARIYWSLRAEDGDVAADSS